MGRLARRGSRTGKSKRPPGIGLGGLLIGGAARSPRLRKKVVGWQGRGGGGDRSFGAGLRWCVMRYTGITGIIRITRITRIIRTYVRPRESGGPLNGFFFYFFFLRPPSSLLPRRSPSRASLSPEPLPVADVAPAHLCLRSSLSRPLFSRSPISTRPSSPLPILLLLIFLPCGPTSGRFNVLNFFSAPLSPLDEPLRVPSRPFAVFSISSLVFPPPPSSDFLPVVPSLHFSALGSSSFHTELERHSCLSVLLP